VTTHHLKCLTPRLAPSSSPRGWKPDEQRGNRHDRGYGWEWEKTRARIIERDSGLCVPCGKQDRTTMGTEVDHITSKAEARANGWTNEQIEADANLQTICESCHREKTSSESNRGGGSR